MHLSSLNATLYAAAPTKDIYDFVGVFVAHDDAHEAGSAQESLGLENTLWANTVLASGSAWGVVIYTGTETRSGMNVAKPSSKVATLDLQARHSKCVPIQAAFGHAECRTRSCNSRREPCCVPDHAASLHTVSLRSNSSPYICQVNFLAKLLFLLVALTALIMVAVPLLTAWGSYSFYWSATQRVLQAHT